MRTSVAGSGSVGFRGEQLCGVKNFFDGTHRQIAPAETIRLAGLFTATAGITRVANITGLDRIGVPTLLAIRPKSQSLVTSSGKGITYEAAHASAVMEAIELYHAEQVQAPDDLYLTYRVVSKRQAVIPADRLPLNRAAVFSEDVPLHWLQSWNLCDQEEVAVPLAFVKMARGSLSAHESGIFDLTSNGLSSGNNLLEAINSGIFEVIERDAISCHKHAWAETGTSPPVVDIDTVRTLPSAGPLVRKIEGAEVGIAIFDCTLDTDIPVFMTWLWDLQSRGFGMHEGYGAHLDPEIALTRSITEAIQSRAVLISGSRDNVFRHEFRRAQYADSHHRATWLRELRPTVSVCKHPARSADTLEEDTNELLRRLTGRGFDQVLVVELTQPGFLGKVVKIVIPGMELPMTSNYRAGSRAAAYARGKLLCLRLCSLAQHCLSPRPASSCQRESSCRRLNRATSSAVSVTTSQTPSA